jgi:hypothetical protein
VGTLAAAVGLGSQFNSLTNMIAGLQFGSPAKCPTAKVEDLLPIPSEILTSSTEQSFKANTTYGGMFGYYKVNLEKPSKYDTKNKDTLWTITMIDLGLFVILGSLYYQLDDDL